MGRRYARRGLGLLFEVQTADRPMMSISMRRRAETHPAAGVKPFVEVAAGPGGISIAGLQEFWVFREVLWGFAVRQVKIRYKQAVIGIGWAILQPVVSAALFTVVLGRLASVASEGKPYLLFALAGLVAWTFFSNAAGSASESLVSNQSLLRKVYFPREVLPLATVGAALVDLVPGLVVLAVAAGLYGIAPSVAWLAIPLLILVLVVFASGFGFCLSAINVYYRDVRYALPFLLQLGLFASPVVYSLQAVPGRWRELYGILNPAAAAIDGFRRVFVHRDWPDVSITLGALGWASMLFVLGLVFFKRLERGFADRA